VCVCVYVCVKPQEKKLSGAMCENGELPVEQDDNPDQQVCEY